MTSETERKNNANRLAYSLECISEDANKIKAVAQMLNYDPLQLQTDMKDLYNYLLELERNANE